MAPSDHMNEQFASLEPQPSTHEPQPNTHEKRLSDVESAIAQYGPMLEDLAHVAAVAADKGMSLGQILAAVAMQLLGHDLQPKPLPAPAP